MINDTDLDKLTALAAAAKPSIFGRHSKANHAFIRACSPRVIESLISRLKEAEADVEEVKDFRDGYKEIAKRERTRAEAAEQRVRELEGLISGLKEAHKVTARERDKWQNRQTQCEEWWRAAEDREKALRDGISKALNDLDYKPTSPPWSCGVCMGHSPEWDGHARQCPKRLRPTLEKLLSPPTADAQVCIAHGKYVPCRSEGEHRYSTNPFWVKSVADFQGSTIEGLTWEPAWEES